MKTQQAKELKKLLLAVIIAVIVGIIATSCKSQYKLSITITKKSCVEREKTLSEDQKEVKRQRQIIIKSQEAE